MTSAVITDVQQPDYPKYQRQGGLELTPEEINALRQCMKNSSILAPSIISAAIGYGICKITPFRANAKYVAIVSGVVGLITGRISAAKSCLTKVASMPNSTLRDRMMESGYFGNVAPQRETLYYRGSQSEVQSPAGPSTEIVFDDYPPMNSYDTYSSINPDNSDFNVSEDTDLSEPINIQKGISYEELRHQNRDEFYKKHKQWYTPKTREFPVKETSEQVPTTSTSNRSPMQEKTKYGDVWD
ncbi:OCAD1 protein, partial [Acromyrmex insinuator]